MDRPTTRRGRHGSNAESVSVADLLARTTPAEQAYVSAAQDRTSVEPHGRFDDDLDPTGETDALPAVTEPVEPAAVEPRVSSRLARTIMMTTAAMLVCGAVATFSVFTNGDSPRLGPSTPSVGPSRIAGSTVVRPDLLNEQLAGGLLTANQETGAGPTGVPAGGGASSAGSLRPQDEARAARLMNAGPALPDSAVGGPQAAQVRKLVRDFYDAMEETPDRAFEMLGPEMRGDGRANFIRSWADVLVEVPQLEGGDGGVVRAVVVIAWPKDATLLRTEQLLVVSDGPEPKIVRAELLSAHRG